MSVDRSWRAPARVRRIRAAVAAVLVLLGVLALALQSWVLGGILAVLGFGVWLLLLRPSLRTEGDTLLVQNVLRRHRITRDAIMGAVPGESGLRIEFYRAEEGRRFVRARAVIRRPGNRVQWADLVVDELQEWVTGKAPPPRELGDQRFVPKNPRPWRATRRV